jgi:1-aminocyclopropane-1-carboxylate deaminase
LRQGVVPDLVLGVPVPLSDFPRYQLTFGPSPLHLMERLSAHLGGARIWAKREDCNAGLAFGGNKVRKLEYLVPDALAQGADTLVSIGGVQSNHTRQVAAVAARLGLTAVLVQERWVDWPDVVYDRVGNIQLSRIMGADVRIVDATGSTHAGMIAGFAGQDRPRRVIGIDASAKLGETRAQVAKIARNTAELIGLGRELREDEITVLGGWAGERYGVPDESTLEAIRLVGRLEGIILDPVYEGKSMAGLIDLVGNGEIGTDSTVLYAHLGGQPALSAYGALFC